MNVPGLQLTVSGRADGEIEAMYVRLSRGTPSRTKELIESTLLSDVDAKGKLLGFEILGPIDLSDLTNRVSPAIRKPFRDFLLASAPSRLIKR